MYRTRPRSFRAMASPRRWPSRAVDLQGPGQGVAGSGIVPGQLPHAPQVGQGVGVGGGWPRRSAVSAAVWWISRARVQGPSVLQDLGQSRGQGDRVLVEAVGVGVGEGGLQVGAFGAQPGAGGLRVGQGGGVRGGRAVGCGPRVAGDGDRGALGGVRVVVQQPVHGAPRARVRGRRRPGCGRGRAAGRAAGSGPGRARSAGCGRPGPPAARRRAPGRPASSAAAA